MSQFAPNLLDGEVAIVTGGGSGLGRATALELARCGAHVVVAGRRAEPLNATAALEGRGRISGMLCDIREEDQVEAMVGAVLERHGRIDLLVNNAGGQFFAPAEAITPKGFRTVVRLNVEGTWLMTHTVATKAMIPSDSGGRIISLTVSPTHGIPGMVHTAAARAAVDTMMRTLAVEWARFDVRLNSIAVGQFGTETFNAKYPAAVVEASARLIPAQRLGREEELAALVVYLASPAADFVSGAVIAIDGARDDWMGPWPPRWATDASGQPVSESRR